MERREPPQREEVVENDPRRCPSPQPEVGSVLVTTTAHQSSICCDFRRPDRSNDQPRLVGRTFEYSHRPFHQTAINPWISDDGRPLWRRQPYESPPLQAGQERRARSNCPLAVRSTPPEETADAPADRQPRPAPEIANRPTDPPHRIGTESGPAVSDRPAGPSPTPVPQPDPHADRMPQPPPPRQGPRRNPSIPAVFTILKDSCYRLAWDLPGRTCH